MPRTTRGFFKEGEDAKTDQQRAPPTIICEPSSDSPVPFSNAAEGRKNRAPQQTRDVIENDQIAMLPSPASELLLSHRHAECWGRRAANDAQDEPETAEQE